MHFQPIERTDEEGHQPPTVAGMEPAIANDSLDDVFGDAGPDDENSTDNLSHPSDMRRLETDHATAGYREGIAVGKQETLQEGFDEGYSMGAAIGLQAGQILGILEGISEACSSKMPQRQGPELDREASLGAEKLLAEARNELSVERLFSSSYWRATGEPSYDVAGNLLRHRDGALAHPLVRKWTAVMEEQLRLWSIDRSVLSQEDGGGSSRPDDPSTTSSQDEQLEHGAQPPTLDPLDW
ncbi:Essential protein Yae1, N terminal [Geosmithia morbida]|uniref:Protein YAE1 n=1 Tax=Geosmithia morbida TaxID=1094350 RepID=A0A9P4YZM3_9HYPO|nr:Essential protein Yae1, N terminal [Geosmithia morbida]KAF4124558.1 Essential protein Yae1, N terminal [Geosmithia morbida]